MADTGWFGHPRGLSTLFFTEMWERFSYYGMRGFLILYMVKALGFTDQHAGAVYGNYVSSVWLVAIVGGMIAEGIDWHLGFACAGVGMTLGLIQYVAGRRRLQPALDRLAARPKPALAAAPQASSAFTREDWKRMAAVVVFFLFASLFWGAFEQAGSTLTLFADRYVRLELLGLKLYASWFVAVQAAFVIVLSPLFAWLWVRLGARQPSSPAKFALALMFVGLAFVLLMPAGAAAQGGVKVSPLWLVGAYFIEELGEVCLYPVGLSVVTKLAPARIVGLMMGVFFLSNALGNKLAGWSAGFISTTPLPN